MDEQFKSIHRLPRGDRDRPQYRTLLTADLKPAPAGEYGDDGQRVSTENFEAATLISSEIWMGEGAVGDEAVVEHGWPEERMHAPCIDFDLPCVLVESSTEGHFHLYINKAITWSAYLGVLDALVVAGLVEEGFVHAARRRGATHLRLPHVKKEPQPFVPTDEEPF